MKWALLVFLTTNFQETNFELVKTLEIATGNLCLQAQQVFLNENKKHAEGKRMFIAYTTFCIKVRE